MLLVALLFATGCRHSQSDVIVGEVSGGIGCDVCAVLLSIDLSVTDSAGVPVSQAELWSVDQQNLAGKAIRLGVTDASGHLLAPHCYMGSTEYAFWRPEESPVVLTLLVLREGYGFRRLSLEPPTADVLSDGRQFEALPGAASLSPAFGSRSGKHTYHLPVSVALSVAQ